MLEALGARAKTNPLRKFWKLKKKSSFRRYVVDSLLPNRYGFPAPDIAASCESLDNIIAAIFFFGFNLVGFT